jgi:hypothetical protein
MERCCWSFHYIYRKKNINSYTFRGRPTTATHILTTKDLDGDKKQKYLKTPSNARPHIVTPEWLFDSIKYGKRQKEWEYQVVKEDGIKSLDEMFAAGSQSTSKS